MLSIQQLIRTLKKLQNSSSAAGTAGELAKSIQHVAAAAAAKEASAAMLTTPLATNVAATLVTSAPCCHADVSDSAQSQVSATSLLPEQPKLSAASKHLASDSNGNGHASCSPNNNNGGDNSSASSAIRSKHSNAAVNAGRHNNISSQLQQQQQTPDCHSSSHNERFSLYSPLNVNGSSELSANAKSHSTQDSSIAEISTPPATIRQQTAFHHYQPPHHHHHHNQQAHTEQQQLRSQRIQNFFQQQIFHQFHTQHNQSLSSKQQQTQLAMSSLAAEPLATPTLKQNDEPHHPASSSADESSSGKAPSDSKQQSSTSGKPCFNTGLGDILQFMELIGNLKHTKRTGWVLRDVNDCESISGHMYRMSILTFLLDGTEGLNQIRCMELALVHDLAESLVGDITPFCGISKEEKKAMEFKAMEDICKLIEPRGKRMMELFEEYEKGESAESRFVKDLDRLDMVMQAFEYEKRDNCLLKHQEFFDSTKGKFNHPFVKKLVGEIYEQREKLAKDKGATPPPKIEVPNMDDPATYANSKKATNGHHATKDEDNASKTS